MEVPDDVEKYFAGRSITTGVVRYRDLGYLLVTRDDLVEEQKPHSRIYEFDRGRIGGLDLEWMAGSATVCHTPEEKFLATGPAGFVQAFGGGQVLEEPRIEDGKLIPNKRGPLREVRAVAGGRAYAVGTARQAYRRDAPGQWVCIDQSAQDDTDPVDTSFESIDGFAENDIYAVGWEGEIWRYNGEEWKQLNSPTNVALYKVRCGGDGYVYACGQNGTLLRGKGNRWKVIEHDATTEDLWGLEWFNDRLYVSSMSLLYELNKDALNDVDWGGEAPPGTCYHLSAADGIMWSIGAKDVMEFDGKLWTRVL